MNCNKQEDAYYGRIKKNKFAMFDHRHVVVIKSHLTAATSIQLVTWQNKEYEFNITPKDIGGFNRNAYEINVYEIGGYSELLTLAICLPYRVSL